MARTLKIGIIGAGATADVHHAPEYERAPGAEVLAVADPNLDRAEFLAKKHGIPIVFQDYRELLRRKEIDAVSICTPNALHSEQALASIEEGKHVLCEVPLALRLADCREMIRAARDRGVLLMPALTYRFLGAHQQAREIVLSGRIGRPLFFRACFAHSGPYASWSAASDWYYDPALSGGGALIDLGQHALDLFLFHMGSADAVLADTATLAKDLPLEDTATCLLHGDQVRGCIEARWCSREETRLVEIHGTDGVVAIGPRAPVRVYTTDTGWQAAGEPAANAAGGMIPHFVACCLQASEPQVSGEDGLRALQLVQAAYESAASGRLQAVGS